MSILQRPTRRWHASGATCVWLWLACGLVALTIGSQASGQGIALRGVSPVNESMAGAAAGCPIDAAGALQWNPASISGLPASDMSFGMELILPQSELSSRINARALGHGFPPVTLAGSTDSEPGVTPVPDMAFVRKVDGSPVDIWAGDLRRRRLVGQLSGQHDQPDPHAAAAAWLGPGQPGGHGRHRPNRSDRRPTKSTSTWSIGFAPTITMAKLYATPLFLGAKDDANGDGFATFPAGVGTRYAWGGGFQVGAYYTTDVGWHFGASVKSPQWVEPFRFNSEDELGNPRSVKFNLYYPTIVSLGASYSRFERWIFAGDVRYFDYGNALGFADSGFNADGSVKGLGWKSVASVALGVQRQVTNRLFVRGGYCYNGNPITPDAVEFNVASPLVVQHSLHTGFSYCFDDNWIVAMAYVHCFENSVTGPLQTLDSQRRDRSDPRHLDHHRRLGRRGEPGGDEAVLTRIIHAPGDPRRRVRDTSPTRKRG